jgi:hypothetical protein
MMCEQQPKGMFGGFRCYYEIPKLAAPLSQKDLLV